MRQILAVSLLAATAAFGQDQTPVPAPPPPQVQSQQPAAAPVQPSQTPQSQDQTPTPAPAQPQVQNQQPATPPVQPSQPPQSKIATTNLSEVFNGPTLSEIYCSGFITRQAIHPSGTILAGYRAPEQVAYVEHDYIYLSGEDVKEGQEYQLLRHMQDPNRYQTFPKQLLMLAGMGEMYQDLGRVKVLYLRKKVGVAQIENTCGTALPGDIAVPFQERPRPEFKQTTFEQFAAPNGKTTGRIVMGRDLDTFIGARREVYLSIGEAQGVKVGDYFRVTRDYTAVAENAAEALPFKAPAYDDTQKNPQKFELRKQIGDLPRRSIGELMVISTTASSATALTTYAPEDIHLGDFVEMVDATPLPPPAVAAAAAPQPPTISCSVSRSTIQVGESANITCNGVAEEGHNLTYNYQASAGQITPRENRATLAASAPGPVTVTATAVDDRNLSAQTTVNVDVQAPPTPPTPPAPAALTTLNELIFKPNSAYVDNRAKAVLDDDALRLQRDASSNLILEGSSNPSEKDTLAAQRAENAKTYLTQSKGIDASRIQTRPATTKTGAKVSVILAPAGAPQQ